jgi:hypothetical protein
MPVRAIRTDYPVDPEATRLRPAFDRTANVAQGRTRPCPLASFGGTDRLRFWVGYRAGPDWLLYMAGRGLPGGSVRLQMGACKYEQENYEDRLVQAFHPVSNCLARDLCLFSRSPPAVANCFCICNCDHRGGRPWCYRNDTAGKLRQRREAIRANCGAAAIVRYLNHALELRLFRFERILWTLCCSADRSRRVSATEVASVRSRLSYGRFDSLAQHFAPGVSPRLRR